jgi:hypothetical protein
LKNQSLAYHPFEVSRCVMVVVCKRMQVLELVQYKLELELK